MADVKISDLPAAGSASGGMQIEVNDFGVSKRITVDQVLGQVVASGVIDPKLAGLKAAAFAYTLAFGR